MKELTNSDIKKISLDILKEVDSFCRKNAIKYSLAYGTLIGAIRHKGFIPWDDDIDILMTRPNFEKFMHTFSNDNGYITSCPSLKNGYMFFGRVYDTRNTIAKPWRPQEISKNIGVWIDVFPVDYVPENVSKYNDDINYFLQQYDKVYRKRYAMQKVTKVLIHPRQFVHLIKQKILTAHINPISIIEEFDKRVSNAHKSKFMGFRGNHISTFKEKLDANVFNSYIDVPFEDGKFMSIKNYDYFLRNFYDDYMKLPPIEKQVYAHSAHKFYWKSK